MKAKRFPLDYDTLKKGDVIPPDRIEQILSTDGKVIRRGTTKYQLGMLALCGHIESELNERGLIWTIKQEGESIKILTDNEAAIYNHQMQQKARASQMKRFALQQAVDTSQLTEDVRKQHDRSIEVDGKFIAAMVGVTNQIRMIPHKRNTPGLPER